MKHSFPSEKRRSRNRSRLEDKDESNRNFEDELNRNFSRSLSVSAQPRVRIPAEDPEDEDELNPNFHEDELNRNFSRSLSVPAQPRVRIPAEDDGLNQNSYWVDDAQTEFPGDNWDSNQNRSRPLPRMLNMNQYPPLPRTLRPGDYNEPRDMNDVIRILNQIKTRKIPEYYQHDDDVKLTRRDDDDNHDRFIYIEEARKGAQMNRTWKQKIFSQRLEDDDEELRKEIDNRLKHYDPDIALYNWVKGFEVGYYPYLMRNSSSLIIRYYCPPDANLPDDTIAHLYGLAVHAINFYNARQQTNYSVVKVIKTMTDVAAGTWFYMTFQASIPCYGDHLWTFEAKLFERIPLPQTYIKVEFVRLKMGAGPSSLIQEPYGANLIQEPHAANLIQEPQACCSSSSFFNPFAGQ